MGQDESSKASDFSGRVDFGKAASDYRKHRVGFPPQFFDSLAARGIGGKGQHILDLGTGTVARGLAASGARVVGLDPSEPLLTEARGIDAHTGLNVEYVLGRAEALDFPDARFHVVTAGQCWHWFDRPSAAAEVYRVLEPRGRVVIAHFDWLPLPGNMVIATEALILSHNPQWHLAGGTGEYPEWLIDLSAAGFEGLETFSFDLEVPYSHEAWRGRIRASAGVKASLSPEQTEIFDAELAEILSARFPGNPLLVPHRVWAVIGLKP